MQRRLLVVVHLLVAPACTELDERAPSSQTWNHDSPDCDYLYRKRLRMETFDSLEIGFNHVNLARRGPQCGPSCDAVLTSVMGALYARLCLTTLDTQQDQKWRVAPKREYFRLQCTGP